MVKKTTTKKHHLANKTKPASKKKKEPKDLAILFDQICLNNSSFIFSLCYIS